MSRETDRFDEIENAIYNSDLVALDREDARKLAAEIIFIVRQYERPHLISFWKTMASRHLATVNELTGELERREEAA